MAVHIGKKIRDEVHRQGMSVTAFARKINRSRNVVYDIFDRESVDTDLLNKIGRVLSCDFFSLYSSQKEYTHEGIKSFHVGENEATYNKPGTDLLAKLQSENTMLKNEINYLKKIISLLESKKGAKAKTK